jgi:hypothetical protein
MSAEAPSKLLTLLLVFIGATVLGALGKRFGAAAVVALGLFGSMTGWVAARWIVRKLF